MRRNQYKQPDNLQARIALHKRFSTNSQDWFDWLFSHYRFPHDARILEIGCGPGDTWDNNREHIPDNWHLTLTDISEGMLGQVRQKLAGILHNLCCVNAYVLPFPEDSFDGLIGNFMLYHVPNLDHTLAEIQRVLSPQGKVITATTGENHLKELFEMINRFDPGHSSHLQQISFTLENAGKAYLNTSSRLNA